MMKKLLEKIFTASDKATVTFAAVMVIANAWLVVESVYYEEEN